MRESIDESTKKQSAPKADLGDEENDSQSSKRSREDSFDRLDSQSPLKVRKKSPRGNGSDEAKATAKTDDTAVLATVSDKCGETIGNKSDGDKHFDIEDDSLLLDDLLGDFDRDVSDSVASVKKPNGGNSVRDSSLKPTASSEGNENKSATATRAELTETEFDGDFGDFFHETVEEDKDKLVEGGIDLQEFRFCKVVEMERENKFLRIKVEEILEGKTATVLCYEFWRETRIEVGEIVSIKAIDKSGKWTVDNRNGFLVTQPHTLISGTTVVGGTFCMRRSVLTESFRGFDDLPNVDVVDSSMMIGTLVHELLQTVLRKKLSTMHEIRNVLNQIIHSRRGIQMMYESSLTQRECQRRMEVYVPKIHEFVKRYVLGDGSDPKDKNFVGKIDRIREIEENVWVPELGLKGKIDVTAEVTVKLNRKIMPLEVKTGQPSFTVEHRGQLMLYNMMLGFIGYRADAGLLLYIRDNIMKEVKNNRHEERDLIMLRNSLAHYVSRLPDFEEIPNADGTVGKSWKNMKLPEPINHPVACSKCPYNVLCVVYAKRDTDLELSKSHVLRNVEKVFADVLTDAHIDYVLKWIVMIKLEDTSSHDGTALNNFWTLEPKMREKKGTCIANLLVRGEIEESENKYLHTFVRKTDECSDDNSFRSIFTENDYIIVSTDTRINVSAGYLRNRSDDEIQILLDRNIVKQNPTATFHLDKYPISRFSGMSLANVACLLNNHEITNKLRGIIIDKNPATFVDKLPRSVAEMGASLLHDLNKYQREAVLKVLAANDYMLIKGMPGSGKTQTLVALIELLVKMGRSVLITAHTHSAVDNILLKLHDRNVDFLRLGSAARAHPKLKSKSEHFLTAECTTVDGLEAVYSSKNVVGVTCCGAFHGLLSKRVFDVCLVDESTQLQQPNALKPIFSAKKFVLIGDPEQLPPIIRNLDAKKMGMGESLFARLGNDKNTVTLKLQYRMNRKIMSIANKMTYNGAMKTGNDKVANSTLRLTDTMVLESCERWISKALSPNLEDSVVVLNAGQTCSLNEQFDFGEELNSVDKKRVCNVLEATIIMRLVAVLLKGGLETKSIGIISPYVAQVELLRNLCRQDIEVNTVDQYQGRDKDVIFYSCTKSVPPTNDLPAYYEILQDWQRLNVAVTRARHKLIVVCDKITMERYEPFKKLFDLAKNDIMSLEPGRDDFSWESLVQLIK